MARFVLVVSDHFGPGNSKKEYYDRSETIVTEDLMMDILAESLNCDVDRMDPPIFHHIQQHEMIVACFDDEDHETYLLFMV